MMFVSFLFAQIPQSINYQAIARETNGTPITNQSNLSSVQFEILEGSSTGNQIFTEIHQNVQLSSTGLFNLKIGSISQAQFLAINWSSGAKYLKVTINGNITSTATEMLSVPYALYAASGVGTQGPQGIQGPQGTAGPQGATGPQGPAGPTQTLSINGNTLTISGGNSVTLPSSGGSGANLSIQEMTILSGGGGSSQVSDFTPTGIMTYSVGGNAIYIAQSKFVANNSHELSIVEFTKDNITGLYYKNRVLTAGQIQSGGIGGMTIFNGELYMPITTSFPQFTPTIRKINLSNGVNADLPFIGSSAVAPIYYDGSFFFIRGSSNTNWRKYQLSSNTFVDNGVAVINIPYLTKFAIFDNGEVLHYCSPDKFVKINTSGNIISDNTVPVIGNMDVNGTMNMVGVMKISSSLIYLVNLSSVITNVGGGNQFIFKLHLHPKTNP